MKTIGRYMVIIIFLPGMTLSDGDRFKENDIFNFFNDIFELHNEYRQKHRVESLRRTFDMDLVAARILDDMFIGHYNNVHDVYGQIIHEKMYDRRTKLDIDEANRIFFELYTEGTNYNYFFEPSNYESCRFTQIMWKDTETFGIALKWTNDKYVVQMVYSPRGNILGQFKNNVLQRPIIAHSNSSLLNYMIYRNVVQNFKDYIVFLHNEARFKHQVPKLQRDKELDKFAYNIQSLISKNMYQYHGMYGKNNIERNYDNNTLLDEAEANAVFLEWYNKGINYNYFVESSNNEAAEFTQIVWRNTKTIGISLSRENGFYRVLVFYNPPGNIKREFTSNVFMSRSMEQEESSSYSDIINLRGD